MNKSTMGVCAWSPDYKSTPARIPAASVAGAPELQPRAGALGVAGGWVSALSAEALAAKWEKRAKELYARAERWENEHPHHGDEATRAEAGALMDCANKLRRQMAEANKRQPTPNQ